MKPRSDGPGIGKSCRSATTGTPRQGGLGKPDAPLTGADQVSWNDGGGSASGTPHSGQNRKEYGQGPGCSHRPVRTHSMSWSSAEPDRRANERMPTDTVSNRPRWPDQRWWP